jgi:RNA polymerase sigma factor (sigma-70 family)
MINGIGAMAPLTGQSHERLIRSDQYESDLVLAAVHDVGIDTPRPTGCSPTSSPQNRMTSNDPIVFVVDDDQGVREATRSLLASVGLRVEAFKTAHEFLSIRRPDGPGCLVLDVRLPGLSGLDLQRELARTGMPIPIVFITAHADVAMSVEAMKGGAVEFLTKPFREQQLLDAVQQAIDRDRMVRQQRAELAELRAWYESLTPREREVMTLVVTGLLNKQIAAELHTSEATVKAHRAEVMRKMRAQSLAQLVRIADRLDLLPPAH